MGIFDKASCDSLEESDNAITDVESVKKTKKKRKSLFDIGTDDINVPDKEQLEASGNGSHDVSSKAEDNQKEPKKSKFTLDSLPTEENDKSAKTGRQTTVNCDENIKYISQKLSEVPSGIIECKVPEIGLIELECKAERHSIILLLTKEEAQSVERKNKCAEYIGSGHPALKEKGKPKAEEIIDGQYLKLLATPDSIHELCEKMSEIEFFFMIYGIDELQSQASYRDDLDEIYDLYLSFPKEKRCIYTADSHAFSNPKFKNEDITKINWHYQPKWAMDVRPCSNIIGVLKRLIEALPQKDKIAIFYFSVAQCRLSILNLDEELQKDCAIYCSEKAKEEAGEFYSNTEDCSRRICFIASQWNLMKLKRSSHLIMVSDVSGGSTLFSVRQIISLHDKIMGNLPIISTTLVHNIFDNDKMRGLWQRSISGVVSKAESMAILMNETELLKQKEDSLQRLFGRVQTILEKEKGIVPGRFSPIRLLSSYEVNNGIKKYSAAYMKIDSLKLRTNLLSKYYSKTDSLAKELDKYVNVNLLKEDKTPVDERQVEIASKEKASVQDRRKYVRDSIISALPDIFKNNDNPEEILLKLIKETSNSDERTLIKEILRLYRYLDINYLAKELKALKAGNKTGFKNLNNRIMVWALDDEHPLKVDVHNTFEIGKIYTNDEINEKLSPIVKYHFNRDFIKEKENKAKTSQKGSKEATNVSKGRKLITIFKYFFETERITRKGYLIKGYTTFEDTGKKRKRIPKDDNNLMRYFML